MRTIPGEREDSLSTPRYFLRTIVHPCKRIADFDPCRQFAKAR